MLMNCWNVKFERAQNWQRLFRYLILTVVFALSSTAAHSATKTLLVLGDSLSAEYGLVRGTGWVALLENRLQENRLSYQVINASISGETTSGGKARIEKLLAMHKPNVVIIELGGNDALRGLSLKATEDNLRAMINASQKAQAQVLLVGMRIPPNYGRDYTEQFFSLFAKLARQTQSGLAPFLLEGVANDINLFQADRIHPLAKAHPTMLNNVWPHLQPLLKK